MAIYHDDRQAGIHIIGILMKAVEIKITIRYFTLLFPPLGA